MGSRKKTESPAAVAKKAARIHGYYLDAINRVGERLADAFGRSQNPLIRVPSAERKILDRMWRDWHKVSRLVAKRTRRTQDRKPRRRGA